MLLRARQRAKTRKLRIRQIDIDFLCLSVFGQRALPDDMAERIATRREFYDAIKDPLGRVADLGPPDAAVVEALAS